MKKNFFTNLFLIITAVICFGVAGKQEVFATTTGGLQYPVVFTSITPRTTKVKVYVEGETTLYVKQGKETLFKKYYKNDGIKTITISKQKFKTKLTFYVKGKRNDKMYTSEKVTAKEVKKAKRVALKAPELSFNADTTEITVKGKVGTKVYIRERNESKKGQWVYYGVILNKSGITKKIQDFDTSKTYSSSEYYEIRLKDLNGKYSEKTNLKLTDYTPSDMVSDIHQ